MIKSVKNIWIFLSYVWFVIMLFIVGLFSGGLDVKASAYEDWTSSQSRYRYDDHGTNTYSSWETTPHTWEPTLPVNKIQWRVKYSQGLSNENTYNIKFAYRPIPQAVSPTRIQVYADTGTVEYEIITCGQWAYNSDNFNVVQCSFTPRNNISANTWLIIEVNLTQGYLTSLRTYMNQFEERLGINSVVTQTGNQITNEINDLGDTITNVINENNQNLINIINQNNTTCETIIINKDTPGNVRGGLSNNCAETGGSGWRTKAYKIEEGTTITGLRTLAYYCFYDENMVPIGGRSQTSASSITIPNGAKFIKFNGSNSYTYDFASLYQCKTNTVSTNDKIEDVNETLTNSDVDSPDSSLEEMQDMLPTNGTITQLIALPITLYQKVLNSINGTCQSFNLGFLYNTNLIIPCIDISTYLGSSIWNSIDLIISGVFVLVIAKKMIKAFEGFTSMKEGDVIND